jgi:hypothetical protein
MGSLKTQSLDALLAKQGPISFVVALFERFIKNNFTFWSGILYVKEVIHSTIVGTIWPTTTIVHSIVRPFLF